MNGFITIEIGDFVPILGNNGDGNHEKEKLDKCVKAVSRIKNVLLECIEYYTQIAKCYEKFRNIDVKIEKACLKYTQQIENIEKKYSDIYEKKYEEYDKSCYVPVPAIYSLLCDEVKYIKEESGDDKLLEKLYSQKDKKKNDCLEKELKILKEEFFSQGKEKIYESLKDCYLRGRGFYFKGMVVKKYEKEIIEGIKHYIRYAEWKAKNKKLLNVSNIEEVELGGVSGGLCLRTNTQDISLRIQYYGIIDVLRDDLERIGVLNDRLVEEIFNYICRNLPINNETINDQNYYVSVFEIFQSNNMGKIISELIRCTSYESSGIAVYINGNQKSEIVSEIIDECRCRC